MAYHNSLSTPSAWARLSKHGGLDVNSISREEAEDLVSQIAVLEEQLNESEGNYERLYSEYEKAKAYYKEVEASIETASQVYLDEKEQLQAQAEADKATIADLKAQLEEQREAKESVETQLAALQEQLKHAQEEAAAAKTAQEVLSAELAAAVQARNDAEEAAENARNNAQEKLKKARAETQEALNNALQEGEKSLEIALKEAQELVQEARRKADEDVEKAEAAAVAAQEEARAAKEAAAAQMVLATQKEKAFAEEVAVAKEAAKIAQEASLVAETAASEALKAAEITKQEAAGREQAWRAEQAAAKAALEEQERQLRLREADLATREAALEGIRAAVSRQDGVPYPYGSRDVRETETGAGPAGLATGTTMGPRPSRSNQRARMTTHQPAVELTALDDGEEVMQEAHAGMHGSGGEGQEGDGVATGTHEGPQELASSRGHPDKQPAAPAVNKPEAAPAPAGSGGGNQEVEKSDSEAAPSAQGTARRTTGRVRKRVSSQVSDGAAAVAAPVSQPDVMVPAVGQKRGRGRPRKVSNAGDHSDEEGAASSGISESASDVTEGTRQRRRAGAGTAVAPALPTVDEEEEVFFDAEEGPLEEPVQRPAKKTRTSRGGTSSTPATGGKATTAGRKQGSTSAAKAEKGGKTTSTVKKTAGRKKAVDAVEKAEEPVGRRTRSSGHV